MNYDKAKEYFNNPLTRPKKYRRPLIIDCDPGIDDALALMLLANFQDDFDIKLISSVAGNTPIDITTTNLKFFAENFFKGVTIAKGSSRPLVKVNSLNGSHVHGKNGLGGYNIGSPNYEVKDNAIEEMRKILTTAKDKVTLVTLGPMTNIAKLLILYPEVKENIEVIYSMIGSIDGSGNITSYSEFNAYIDPEAFDLVVKFNIPMVINPLQLGQGTKIPKEVFINKPTKSIKDDFVKTISKNKNDNPDYVLAFDINTIAGLVKPELYTFVPCDINVYTGRDMGGKTELVDNPNGIHKYQKVIDTNKLTDFILNNLLDK